MPRIAIRTCESIIGAATKLHAWTKKNTDVRAPKMFAMLGHFGPASLVTLNAEGAFITGSLPDASLAVVFTVVSSISNRFRDKNDNSPPPE
ncbi:hypothetical protein [Burkholderia sp. Ac-20365]|uniref:hypothetical protein n=1 Tax=Burkholderia sp. Ac-20365 TaxID=2703897 RepID=UPI00197B1764|nr:hypothetical protein [Burkholderia sp. Ac-20365]MBN3759209.1 hypothetical protein [Burkholderia sp. Ac-20365]